ncbi:hypothetical protein D3C76_1255530 [compost metagenome]
MPVNRSVHFYDACSDAAFGLLISKSIRSEGYRSACKSVPVGHAGQCESVLYEGVVVRRKDPNGLSAILESRLRRMEKCSHEVAVVINPDQGVLCVTNLGGGFFPCRNKTPPDRIGDPLQYLFVGRCELLLIVGVISDVHGSSRRTRSESCIIAELA